MKKAIAIGVVVLILLWMLRLEMLNSNDTKEKLFMLRTYQFCIDHSEPGKTGHDKCRENLMEALEKRK